MQNEQSVEQTLLIDTEYPVYPPQEGEWDRPLNPYSPV
jgi:hypothetical protein